MQKSYKKAFYVVLLKFGHFTHSLEIHLFCYLGNDNVSQSYKWMFSKIRLECKHLLQTAK